MIPRWEEVVGVRRYGAGSILHLSDGSCAVSPMSMEDVLIAWRAWFMRSVGRAA